MGTYLTKEDIDSIEKSFSNKSTKKILKYYLLILLFAYICYSYLIKNF